MSAVLARSIGKVVGQSSGLTVAYLPDGVSDEFGEAIVRSANDERRVAPPYAIMVRDDGVEDLSDQTCLRMRAKRAIEYRRGNRFAVVMGRRPDIKSFESYREVLDAAYPASAGGELGFEGVARRAVEILAADALSPSTRIRDAEAAADRLVAVMRAVQRAYEALGQGSLTWNAYWFRHVEIGLERLGAALLDARESQPQLTPDEALASLSWPSFGLPSPANESFIGRSERRQGREIAEALVTHWADEESIRASCKQLRFHPDTRPAGEPHSLEGISWDGFTSRSVGEGNLFLAWQEFLARSTDATWAFAEFTERQFLYPEAALVENGIELCDAKLGELALEPGTGAPAFVRADLIDDNFRTSEMALIVPASPEIDEGDVRRSKVSVGVSSKAVKWEGNARLEGNRLVCRGSFTLKANRAGSLIGKPINVTLIVPASDPLEGHVAEVSSGPLYLLPAQRDGMLLFPRRGTGAWSRPKAATRKSATETFSDLLEVASQPHTIVAWSDAPSAAALNGRPLEPREDGVASGPLRPSGADTVESGSLYVDIVLSESGKEFQSPLVAALLGGAVSSDEPGTATIESVRGCLEEFVAAEVGQEEFVTALGHVAAVEADAYDITAVSPTSDGALLAPTTLAPDWHRYTNFRVSPDVVNGADAARFRRAFKALALDEFLTMGPGHGAQLRWPSKTSWASLWVERSEELHEYLISYVDLMRSASTQSAQARFWATYPFSLSVWETGPDARCRALLLSPLHPLRLTWLAAAEAALADVDIDLRGLGGIIEGWNFPQLGPRDNANGRMVAVPMDSGAEQIFAGWSLLVDASVNGFARLQPPSRIAGMTAPGGAISGLNGAVVSSALRTYRRINPHVSMLSIDLAAFGETPRATDVDDAILNAIEEWNTDPDGVSRLRGGIRVSDSLNRIGDVPRESLDRLLARGTRFPLVWTRYRHDSMQANPSNLRLLQDAGIGVEVTPSDAAERGVLGAVPLRRFEVTGGIDSEGVAWTKPTPPLGCGWEPFSAALRTAELADDHPAIGARLYGTALVDEAADWTVSGESLVSPTSLAALVSSEGGGQQMLWEWRPPYLDMSGSPQLERRPFVSVVRIPSAFRKQVEEMLAKARGREVDSYEVDQLIETLGTRGVGLSSLVAMGGTHAAGALGFYLAFRLMEQVEVPGALHVVVPIDAFDSFLRVLAGTRSRHDSLRRADLLVVRIEAGRICFVPVEIKFYGFHASEPPARLPSGAAELAGPLSQLQSTTELLQEVRDRWSELRSAGNPIHKELWLHGLASLVESGLRLTPGVEDNADRAQDALESILSDQVEVDVGKPLIAFFGHEAFAADGARFDRSLGETSAQHTGLRQFGALVANTAASFDAVDGLFDDLAAAWATAVEWAGTSSCVRESSPTVSGPTSEAPGRGGTAPAGDADPRAQADMADEEDAIVYEPSMTPEVDMAHAPERGDDAQTAPDAREMLNDGRLDEVVPGVGVKFPVGTVLNALGSAQVDFWPGNTALTQMNIGVAGDLGTGKTQLLKATVAQLRREAGRTQDSPLSFLIFDYKRDFQDEDFLEEVRGRVLRPHRIPLNLFALRGQYTALAAYQRAQAFIDILAKIYSGIGPVQRDRLLGVITDLYREKDGGAPRLHEILERYRGVISGADSVTSVLNTFVLGEIFDDDPACAQSFEGLIDDTVLVVGLSEFGADQNAKNALVVLFLNQYYEYMLQLRKWPFVGTDPQVRRLNSFLLVDEAVNIMKYEFPVLMNLMLQGREFGVGVILASQYLTHFRQSSTNYGEPLRTWLIHRVPSVTARELRTLGIVTASDAIAERISTLGVHEALAVTLDVPGTFVRGTPFYELMEKGGWR